MRATEGLKDTSPELRKPVEDDMHDASHTQRSSACNAQTSHVRHCLFSFNVQPTRVPKWRQLGKEVVVYSFFSTVSTLQLVFVPFFRAMGFALFTTIGWGQGRACHRRLLLTTSTTTNLPILRPDYFYHPNQILSVQRRGAKACWSS